MSPGEAQVALTSLQSKDWFEACAGCNLTRRLAVHHKEQCTAMLDQLVPLVLKNVKSLRSSLCKTAVMCTADLFQLAIL
ncbi:hypothetical protein WJX72_000266 [[Myrmecia] bisecta]|uniref:Uncharacterized protein n=1 Tax=[Myrmecia] bisecta TaxID=41462 RepID=A0AAW1P4P6_9CHLO